MRTIVYVDGYNFYYGCCKRTPFRWVNLKVLLEKVLPKEHLISNIYYFTAAIKPQPHDPGKRARQGLYWRALRTLPNLTIVEGDFLETPKKLPRIEYQFIRALRHWVCRRYPKMRKYMHPPLVKVWKSEEKRSDVNLATRMLIDAFDDRFDCAVIVSNDTDLLSPILEVRKRFKKKVGILTGHKYPSHTLQQNIDFLHPIREGVLKDSLFSDVMIDRRGQFLKPKGW